MAVIRGSLGAILLGTSVKGIFKRTPLAEPCHEPWGQELTMLEYDLYLIKDERAVDCVLHIGLGLRLFSNVLDVGAYNVDHGTKL
jgi:hypothetical protein